MSKKFARIRTRNHTARPLRRSILTDHWAVVRLGSLTSTKDCGIGRNPIEINTIDSIINSRDKLKMKSCFESGKVPQADWWKFGNINKPKDLPYPLVIKRICGFQGRGMTLINDFKEMSDWLENHPNTDGWFVERFYNYAREYRLHVASDRGVFLSWRKLRLRSAKERWFFNSQNCEWYGEGHKLFDKPKCWDKMCEAAMNALTSCGLDIGAVDIRVQSNKQEDPKFIVCEINSAPALGEAGVEEYKKVIKDLINSKANERVNM